VTGRECLVQPATLLVSHLRSHTHTHGRVAVPLAEGCSALGRGVTSQPGGTHDLAVAPACPSASAGFIV
jgi:hypothetical protein